MEWNGELSVVIFDLGQDDGVVHGAGGTVIDAAGQPVTGGALRVIKVTRRLAVATVKLPAAQVERAGHVRLDPEP